MTNPIIPGTQQDRTGTAGIIRRAESAITARFTGLTVDALAAFDRIPTYTVNADATAYGFTQQQMQAVSADLQAAVDRWLLSGQDEYAFWYDRYVVEAQFAGTAQSAANLATVSEVYAATRTLQQIIFSTPYQNRAATAKFKSYEHWTGLAAQQKTQLAEVIGRAVIDGKNPRDVRDEIRVSLDVTASKAKQYAQTDITDTLRTARMAEADQTAQDMQLRIGLLWSSALKPTTRPWHASRNGQVYTTAQVRDFYSVNGNRYGCLCGISECLLDSEGKPILTDGLKKRMAAAKAAWQKENLNT